MINQNRAHLIHRPSGRAILLSKHFRSPWYGAPQPIIIDTFFADCDREYPGTTDFVIAFEHGQGEDWEWTNEWEGVFKIFKQVGA
jgi:hypothetical protein